MQTITDYIIKLKHNTNMFTEFFDPKNKVIIS